jgi:hypothetical protein
MEESDKKVINAIAFMLFIPQWLDDNEEVKYLTDEYIMSLKENWEKHWIPALTEEHCGDCTNVPMPCTRCHAEELFQQAERVYNILEGK